MINFFSHNQLLISLSLLLLLSLKLFDLMESLFLYCSSLANRLGVGFYCSFTLFFDQISNFSSDKKSSQFTLFLIYLQDLCLRELGSLRTVVAKYSGDFRTDWYKFLVLNLKWFLLFLGSLSLYPQLVN